MENEETLKINDDSTNKILEAIGELKRDLSQEFNQKIGDLRCEMNERFERIETEVIEIKELQFSCDVRIDRVQALTHGGLNIGHNLKADVKIMTGELRAWSKDVLNLQEGFI